MDCECLFDFAYCNQFRVGRGEISYEKIKSRIKSNTNVVFCDPQSNAINMLFSYEYRNETKTIFADFLVSVSNKPTFVFSQFLGVLSHLALNTDCEMMSALVSEENQRMLNIATKFNAKVRECTRPGYKEFTIEVSDALEQLKDYYSRLIKSSKIVTVYQVEFINDIAVAVGIASSWKQIYKYSTSAKERHIYLKNSNRSFHGNNEMYHELLVESKIQDNTKETICPNKQVSGYTPTQMFILPTEKCNLQCSYCYSDASPRKSSTLDIEHAKIGIDFIIENAKKQKSGISICFHGGGEPFCEEKVVYKSIDYTEEQCKKNNVKYRFQVSTNATLLHRIDGEYLAKFSSIQLSFDGIKDIQDLHRPFYSTKGSFDIVVENIKYIKQKFPKIHLTIRSTISSFSVSRMPEMLVFFADLGISSMVFEPLFITGRAVNSTQQVTAPSMIDFVNYFMVAERIAEERDVRLSNGGSFLYRDCGYCGATRDNFVLTPDGEITTCVEVTDASHRLFTSLNIGSCKEKVHIDMIKVSKLRSKVTDLPLECKNCIAEKSCRGGCITRMSNTEDKNDFRVSDMCIMQTRMFMQSLLNFHSSVEESAQL